MAPRWFGQKVSAIRAQVREEFVDSVDGALSAALAFREITDDQHRAWRWTAAEVHNWASTLGAACGHWLILLEYSPPLVTARPDVVVVTDEVVVVCEVKTGRGGASAAARRQAHGYAEDLYWFHPGCRGKSIVAVVLSDTDRGETPCISPLDEVPRLEQVRSVDAEGLQAFLADLSTDEHDDATPDESIWLHADYRPRPSIVDAAVALVAANQDPGITAALTDDEELQQLTELLVDQVHQAAKSRDHRVLLVSGVPGAGKTLVGLRLAHDPSVVNRLRDLDSVPLYLTGNGPLVQVLTEALARDFHRRNGTPLSTARRQAGTLVKLVHSFTRAGLTDGEDHLSIPHVAIFDEGQRVWNAEQMRSKHTLSGNDELSEPDVILRRLEAKDWAVVVVLVGEGQEINTGESGVELWLDAISRRTSQSTRHWIGIGARHLTDQSSDPLLLKNDALHLQKTRRSIGTTWLSDWVAAVLEGDAGKADGLASHVTGGEDPYPLVVTRDLADARTWLQAASDHARCGVVASARAGRLRPYGLEMSTTFQAGIEWPHWFLDRPPSLASSSALEVAASEFKCQGLELDYVCLAWSWDFIRREGAWQVRRLNARRLSWRTVKGEKRRYGINAYRVLLTRARRGLVIWVPRGTTQDATRPPEPMDQVADFLQQCGMSPLPAP